MNELLAQPQAWGLILGVIAPLLISVVQQPKFTGATRSVIAVAAAAVIGVLTVLSTGDFDPSNLLTTFAVTLVASHAAYESFYKPTGLADVVEFKTSTAKSRGEYDYYDEDDLAA